MNLLLVVRFERKSYLVHSDIVAHLREPGEASIPLILWQIVRTTLPGTKLCGQRRHLSCKQLPQSDGFLSILCFPIMMDRAVLDPW
jgi:hypothetical protein